LTAGKPERTDVSSVMKQTNKCPKCGSGEVIADAMAVDANAYPLSVATELAPEALVFKDRRFSDVTAWVCAQCGYVELYAKAPGTLKKG